MSTIPVKDVLDRISTLLLDSSPQFTRFTERELLMWLNDGQRAIAKYLPFAYTRIDAVKLKAGTKQSIATILAANIINGDGSSSVNMRGIMMLNIIRNMGADGLTAGVPVRIIPVDVQDDTDSTWHTVPGTGFIEHYTFDPKFPKDFYVVPAVNPVMPTWAEIGYLASPIELPVPALNATLYTTGSANANTTITLDDNYVDDLVNYVVARAYSKDSEYASNQSLATMYTTLFAQSLNAMSQTVMGINPNLSFLPFAPNPLGSAK